MKSSFARLSTLAVCAAAWLPGSQPSSSAQTSSKPQTSAAQTPGAAAHRPASATHRPAGPSARTVLGCAPVPPLSAKIPAVPAGLGCARSLYTITSSARELSPLLSAALKENLEKLNQSFTIAYIDTKVGTGELAAAKMYYTVNYTGYLVDGTKFDSSEGKEPITFPYGAHRVIQGWDTGFEGMHVGGKRRLFVPYQLAYGEAGRPPVIPAKAELIFDIELVSQSDKPPTPKTPLPSPAGATGATGPSGATGATGLTGASGVNGGTGSAPATNVTGSTPATQPTTRPATPPGTSAPSATPATGATGPKQ